MGPEGYTIVSTVDGSVLFDSFATPQNRAAGWVADQPPGRRRHVEHGAWIGTQKSRQAADIYSGAISAGKGYLEYYGTKLPAKLQWISDGMSKTILVSELAGSPELIVGKERQQGSSGLMAWIIAEAGWVHGPLWIRRKKTILDTQYLKRPVNFSNFEQIFSFHPDGAHVSMCDGSVRFLSEAASPEAVFALAARANGEVIDSP